MNRLTAIVAGALVALVASVLPAQAQGFSTVKGYVYASGANPATASTVYQFSVGQSSIVCGQAPVAIPSPGVNVNTVYWDDPVTAGKQCHALIVAINTGNASTPVGLYDLYLTGTSTASAEGPKNGPFALQVSLPPSAQITGVGAK